MENPDNKGKVSITLERGERGLVIGQTGSGKTGFSTWLIQRMPMTPIIIMDTKEEKKFERLQNSVIVDDMGGVDRAMTLDPDSDTIPDYIVLRPDVFSMNDPVYLDNILLELFTDYRNIGIFIDEGYTFHKGGRAGPGLMALMTRGRSRGLTVLICSQRPSWIAREVITESQRKYIFRLIDRRDKKTLGEVIPDFENLPNPQKFGFWYYDDDLEKPIEFAPVKLDPELETGYVDDAQMVDDDDLLSDTETPRFTWI